MTSQTERFETMTGTDIRSNDVPPPVPSRLASGDSLEHLTLTTRRTSYGVELIAVDPSGIDAVLGLLYWLDDDAWLLCLDCREEITLEDGGVCDSCRVDMAQRLAQVDDSPSLGDPWWAER